MRKPTVNLPIHYATALESVTLVTASSRLARELRYAFDYEKSQANERVWERPQIQSYEQWLLASYRQLGFCNPQLAERSVVSHETFMLLAQQQAPNKEVEMHARAIVDAWQLVWDANLWVDFQDIRSTENGRLCDDWFQRIRRCLDRERLITVDEIPEVLQRAIERHDWQPKGVLSYGFKEPSAAQRNLFDALRTRELCSEVNNTPVVHENATHRLHGFEKANEEFSTLALWSREKLAKFGSNATIGVVVHGLANSFPAVKRSFESVFPEVAEISRLVSIDSGRPLTQNRIYLDFIHVLKWTCGSLGHDVLLQLARSPYLERLNLNRKPQKWFSEHMTIRYYRSRMPSNERSVLDRVVQIAPQNHNRPLPFTEIADILLELMRLCGFNEESADRFAQIDATAIKVFSDLVLRLAQAAAIQPRISWSRFIDLVEVLAADQSIRVTRPDAPIQVMGREASTLLRFDALWVTGVSDVDWPAVPRPNPFIPRQMQKRANLRGVSHEHMLEDAHALTNHWRNCANEVVFSYVSQIDKVQAQPSNLFADLSNPRELDDDMSQATLVHHGELIDHGHPWSTYSVAGAIREYQQDYGSKVAADDVKAATRLLRNQAQCPFKGWAVHRAGFEEVNEPISRFPNAAQRGSLFHYVVEEILNRAKTQEQLAKLDEKTYFEVIDKVLTTKDEAKNLPARFLKHERERIRRWIDVWLEVQINRRLPFEVVEVEKEINIEIQGLTFKGYIDRIDRTESLDCLIIDHKTGSSYTTSSWDPDQMSDTQMAMYATAETDCDGVAYLSIYRTVDGLRTRWQGVEQVVQQEQEYELAVKLGNYESLDSLKQAWRDRLCQIVSEHLDGKADVSPVEPDVCTYCHLSNLCRIYEDQSKDYSRDEGM
ncbi:MAG: PD-(D/E)XK nuclease family protein [Gammaproteobacteria bacterium]|nr:PD-(D/E)XK nuclease family protein [Gammaproteobacteria bacterium]